MSQVDNEHMACSQKKHRRVGILTKTELTIGCRLPRINSVVQCFMWGLVIWWVRASPSFSPENQHFFARAFSALRELLPLTSFDTFMNSYINIELCVPPSVGGFVKNQPDI